MVAFALVGVVLLAGLVVLICFWPDLRASWIPRSEIRRAVERMEEGYGPDAVTVAQRRMTRAHAQFDNSGTAYWRRVHHALRAREKPAKRPHANPARISTTCWATAEARYPDLHPWPVL